MQIFPGNPNEKAARALYGRIVEQARQPAFYRDYGVPDSVDGRFELLLLHSFLVFNRLRGQGEAAAALGQTLFDLLIFHLDQSIRESGVGDLKVGPKLKAMGEAFYGRSRAYHDGLEESAGTVLQEALSRNVYGSCREGAGTPPTAAMLDVMAGYVRGNATALDNQAVSDLLAGRVSFLAPPETDLGDRVGSEANHV